MTVSVVIPTSQQSFLYQKEFDRIRNTNVTYDQNL